MYAVRDAILVHCACPATRPLAGSSVHCSKRKVALTSQELISCGLRKVFGNLRNTTVVREFS
jgi:hypothetical protein